MRCFVAVTPSVEIRFSAESLARKVCTSIKGAKIVPAANMHLTLRFLGEITDGDAKTLALGLEGVTSGFAPFRAVFGGMGAFPLVRNAGVLWLGVKDGGEAIKMLAERVNLVAGRQAPNTHEKPFVPHLTLARFREPADFSRLEVFSELMQTESGMCTIGCLSLMRSHLGPAGPVYEELCSCSLKA